MTAMAIRRDLGQEMARSVDRAILSSLLAAKQDPDRVMRYVRSHARDMDDRAVRSYIELHVNEFSLELGDEAQGAVNELLIRAEKAELIEPSKLPLMAY